MMYVVSLIMTCKLVAYDGVFHFKDSKINSEVGLNLEWIPSTNNDVVNVINSLNELVLHGHLRQLGRYDHIYSITEKERKYWNESNNKF
ncbi:hypothetical protein [Vibrio sp. A2-1]|uniref:hypothetical protein n=1 Tax=Vibrio sp. A2-1 TaxID=2912252 RepID=UPI001F45F58C|nr:hypothetical protein [Vibrio sp. A2-1]MCF7486964.1 hypothetical protein [Vibrio sp. A2-1]